jgi:hypothetical protein
VKHNLQTNIKRIIIINPCPSGVKGNDLTEIFNKSCDVIDIFMMRLNSRMKAYNSLKKMV